MEFIKGFTFLWDGKAGDVVSGVAKSSLDKLVDRTHSDTVILAFAARQDTAQSTEIDYKGDHLISDEELVELIKYAKSKGLKVILKPTVNVKNGTWRAHISFFDEEVPGEPTWASWFKSYEAYQVHYAKIAEETKCYMMIVGCEMVQSEKREEEWRHLIKKVKSIYFGLVTYNTDKYQEGNVGFWDALDVISSSGYYPPERFEKELERIKKVIDQHNKPFFFAEAGCPSVEGSMAEPNNWALVGKVSVKEQETYYKYMFKMLKANPWVRGIGLWDWGVHLHTEEEAQRNAGYGVYNKPAEKIVQEYFDLV